MSSSRSSKRRNEGTMKGQTSKESSVNGTDDSEAEPVVKDDSDSADNVSAKDKRPKRVSQTLNKSVLTLSDDLKKLIDRVVCCSCGKQVNVMNFGSVRRHPWLKVVTCKKCFRFLRSGPFTRDDDGTDQQCRWCGDGGHLYGCDYCHNCFCRSCIKRNLGRSEAASMDDEDRKWHCYMCKPKKIKKLVEDCNKILDYVAMEMKKDKEAEARRLEREKEKEANAVKTVKQEKKEKDSEEEADKTDHVKSKGLPPPKHKSQVGNDVKKEIKDESKKENEKERIKAEGANGDRDEIKKENKTVTSSVKQDSDLIVVDDSALKISQHHRSRAYKPDPATGVKQVQKCTNGVLEVTVGPKNNQPVVSTQAGKSVQLPHQKILSAYLTQGVPGLQRGLGVRKPTPPNDIKALKSKILPYSIDGALDNLSTMAQSLNLTLSSAKTDIAIAKLSNVNMYQARQKACTQVANGLEFFLNGLRQIWSVQLVANNPPPSTSDGADLSVNLLNPDKLNVQMFPASGFGNPSQGLTSILKKSSDHLQTTSKLNESIIPIEISASPLKDGKEEKMETDNQESDTKVISSEVKTKETISSKSGDEVNMDETENKLEKDVVQVSNDKHVTDVVSSGNGSNNDDAKQEEKVRENVTKERSEEVADSSAEPENFEDKEDDKNGDENVEDDNKDVKKSSKNIVGKEKSEDNESEKEERKHDSDDNLDHENTAAELELLKEMADELNEKECHSSEEETVEEEEQVEDVIQPRRSSRTTKNVESQPEDASDTEQIVRRSSRQKSKPESDKVDDKSCKTDKPSKSARSSERTKKENSELAEKEEKLLSNKEKNIPSEDKKTSKNPQKSSKKSKIVYESNDEKDDDDDDDTIEESDDDRSKKSKIKSEIEKMKVAMSKQSKRNKEKRGKNKDEKQNLSDDSDEESNSKTDEKNSKTGRRSKLSSNNDKEKKVSKESASDDNTEVEEDTKELGRKGKDSKKTKKETNEKESKGKSPVKNKEKEISDELDDLPTDGSDTSSSEEEFPEFGKRSLRRSNKNPKSSSSRTRQQKSSNEDPSDSDFDANLEKEIQSLSKETRLSRKKQKAKTEEKKASKSAKEDKKDRNKKADKKSKPIDDSDLSSNEEVVSEDMEDSEDDTDNVSASQLNKLKQAGKAALEDSDDEDDVIPEMISSDSSDPEVSFPKLSTPKKGKKHGIEDSDDSDFVTPKKNKKIKNKLLDIRITDSESDSGKKGKRGKRGKRKRKGDTSDFSELSDEAESRKKGKKRRRIKKVASSDEEKEPGAEDEIGSGDEDDGTPGGFHKRKHIRRVIGTKKLKDATKAAQKAEEERRKRIEERQKEYNSYVEVEGGEEEEEDLPEGTEREMATPVKADSIAKILGSPRKVPVTTKCVLELDKDKKKSLIEVDRTLVRKLKPHQVEAVRFMYNCCVESLEELKKDKEGSGCIVAHCMGLGKTLSVITFVHTMLSNYKLTKMSKCLVVCPLNTVLNWVNEFEIWLDDVDFEIEIYEMSRVKQNFERAQMLKEWHEGGAGVLIMGYDMYRNLVNGSHCKNKKQRKIFYETLADPGPDLTICDEGHILKNDATSLSKAMMKIKSPRRIVLTGTPLQNNLGEYHCMVNFVKPSLLGTRKEFNNRFNNPITNGQCSDSTAFDVKLMKRRAHILHELLAGCVQRKDYSALTKFLPPKFEYVISVRLSEVQMKLYEKYLELTQSGALGDNPGKGARLFRDYQNLMRIWTHPWVLKLDEIRQDNKRQFDDSEDSFVDDSSCSDSFIEDSMSSGSSSDSSDDSSTSGKKKRKRKTRRGKSTSSDDESKKGNDDEVVKKWKSKRRGNEEGAGSSWMDDMGYGNSEQKGVTSEWWAEFVKEEDESKLDLSGKLVLLFEILKMCEDIGDKVLLFSQSLLSLDIIEDFLQKIDDAHHNGEDLDKPSTSTAGKSSGSATGTAEEKKEEKTEAEKAKERLSRYGKSWTKGADYFRMDGSTNSQNRKAAQDMFNDPENYRARLFLISTKAGSLGINLVSANRVIIFDASWNPSHDIQSIFRVYRFGQVKPVYVYRFLAQGTMEEKIYERQVTKQSLSQRVVDEHQIERHFTANDLQELYRFTPDRLDDPKNKDKPLPMLPKDHMLAELMTNNKEWIVTYHEHDSLLENVVEQELTEEEKKAAWEDYENEKKGLNKVQQMFGGQTMNPSMYATQQMNMQNLLLQGQANLGQAAVLQIVQDLKARFPNLPPEIFQQRVQAVLRQVLTQQIMQQSAFQRQQVEQQRLNELNRLNQMKQQIQRQQAMINNPQNMYNTSMGNQRVGQVQSLLTGNVASLNPQAMNPLSVRSSAPIDLTGQSPNAKK